MKLSVSSINHCKNRILTFVSNIPPWPILLKLIHSPVLNVDSGADLLELILVDRLICAIRTCVSEENWKLWLVRLVQMSTWRHATFKKKNRKNLQLHLTTSWSIFMIFFWEATFWILRILDRNLWVTMWTKSKNIRYYDEQDIVWLTLYSHLVLNVNDDPIHREHDLWKIW